jgi:hypothetical protein
VKILVSAKKGQGLRDNDFCFVPERELVRFAFECDDEGPDGSCGCKRRMGGIATHKSTTTFKVANTNLAKEAYVKMILKSFDEGGWLKLGITEEMVRKEADELLRLASTFRLGTILEKRGPDIQVRKVKKRK